MDISLKNRLASWGGIFVLAFGVRAAVVLSAAPAPYHADALGYHSLAVSVVDRGVYALPTGERAARGPGYPLFLAGVYATLGRNPTAVLLVQALLGAAACVLVAAAAEGLLGPGYGAACGAAAALYRGMIDPAGALLSEGLYAALLAGALAALAWPSRRTLAAAVAAGAAFGGAALTRPEALPAALLILLGARVVRPDWRRRDAAAAVAALALPVLLWAGRNLAVLGRPLAGSSRGGISMYAGLQMPLERLGLPVEPFFQPPGGLGELAEDAQYRAAFHRLWAATPATGRVRAYAFDLASVLYPFLPGYDATFVLLAPLWLLGLAAAARRRAWWPAAGLLAASLAAYTFFGGPVSRYRDGIAPLFILLAGLGLQVLRGRAGPRRAAAALGAWAVLNAAVWAAAPHIRAAALAAKGALWR